MVCFNLPRGSLVWPGTAPTIQECGAYVTSRTKECGARARPDCRKCESCIHFNSPLAPEQRPRKKAQKERDMSIGSVAGAQ
eukprot:1811559-Amphidinium_carterae.1